MQRKILFCAVAMTALLGGMFAVLYLPRADLGVIAGDEVAPEPTVQDVAAEPPAPAPPREQVPPLLLRKPLAAEDLFSSELKADIALYAEMKEAEEQLVEHLAVRAQLFEEFLEEVAAESLDRTIEMLLYHFSSHESRVYDTNYNIAGYEKLLENALARPRIQKILETAEYGTAEERAALAEQIAAACRDFAENTPIVGENPWDPALADPVSGAAFLVFTLPALDHGAEYFEFVASMQHLHQAALHQRWPSQVEGQYKHSIAAFLYAHAADEYFQRLVHLPEAAGGLTLEQQNALQAYVTLVGASDPDDVSRFRSQAPALLELSRQFWGF